MNALRYLLFGAMIVTGSCLDLTLFDEMRVLDAGSAPTGGSTDSSGAGPTGATNETPALPTPDPNDKTAPKLATPNCVATEQLENHVCSAEGPLTASLRFRTDEPAKVTLVLDGIGRTGILSTPWSTDHHVVVTDLEPDVLTPITVTVSDINDNTAELDTSVTGLGGPTVAITEILADPNGPEPGQEFVEIANFGLAEIPGSGQQNERKIIDHSIGASAASVCGSQAPRKNEEGLASHSSARWTGVWPLECG